jgi:hypothetical protein
MVNCHYAKNQLSERAEGKAWRSKFTSSSHNAGLRMRKLRTTAARISQCKLRCQGAVISLKAREAGLNLLVDIGELRIPGMLNGYKAAEKSLNNNPNTVLAFLKAMAEGVVLAKKDKALATKAIGKFVKIDDQMMLDSAYDAYAPHWETSFAVRDQVIRADLGYLNEKEFPQAKRANTREFFDNSFVEKLEKAGFFQTIGIDR